MFEQLRFQLASLEELPETLHKCMQTLEIGPALNSRTGLLQTAPLLAPIRTLYIRHYICMYVYDSSYRGFSRHGQFQNIYMS